MSWDLLKAYPTNPLSKPPQDGNTLMFMRDFPISPLRVQQLPPLRRLPQHQPPPPHLAVLPVLLPQQPPQLQRGLRPVLPYPPPLPAAQVLLYQPRPIRLAPLPLQEIPNEAPSLLSHRPPLPLHLTEQSLFQRMRPRAPQALPQERLQEFL